MMAAPLPSSSSSPSPEEQVTSDDQLLKKILSGLPARSLLRFKAVSIRWYFLITSPSFNVPRPDPPSGLFVPIQIDIRRTEYEFVPFDVEDPVKAPLRTLNFDPDAEIIDLEHSSNGLMLCHSEGLDVVTENSRVFTHKYYIYNPSIDLYIRLPRFEHYDTSRRYGMTLAYDPSRSPHYKIICVCGIGPSMLIGNTAFQIEIYSSETGTCTPSHKFSLDTEMNFRAGVYCNNIIHWPHKRGYILFFNLEDESMYKVQTPLGPIELGDINYSNCIFESRDHLLLVEIHRPLTSRFNIVSLNDDYTSWSLMYRVDLEEVGEAFPEIVNPFFEGTFEFFVMAVVLGERESDSFMVLELPWKALRFNFATRNFHKLCDFAVCRLDCFFITTREHFYSQFNASLYSFL